MNSADPAALEAAILRQTEACADGRSICPSEVARALEAGGDRWRRLLGPLRAAAIRLARRGEVEVLRKGRKVDPEAAIRGVIRLRKPLPETGP
jgi:hypothetical protein